MTRNWKMDASAGFDSINNSMIKIGVVRLHHLGLAVMFGFQCLKVNINSACNCFNTLTPKMMAEILQIHSEAFSLNQHLTS